MDQLRKDFKFSTNKPTVTPNLHGWLGEGNQLLLKKYITDDYKLIFEFGSWLGLSAEYILNNTDQNCIVICIDTWEGDWSIKQTTKYKKHLQNLYDTFIVNMWKWKDRLIPVKMDGRKAMKYLHDLGLTPDLIYLDMDHSYESAKGDLKLLMKYFPDTLILGDDILYWKGVAQAVKEIIREYKISNLEINKNCYALIPSWYSKKFKLKELIMKTIKPKDQYIDFKVAIIVGYHKKYHTKTQLLRFINYMTNFMEKTKLDYKIFILKQTKKELDFNLGKLYNAGFEIAENENFNKFIFQDINLLPKDDMIPYYTRDANQPIHLGYHYKQNTFDIYYLGIIMFNSSNFKQINGYPNNILGWYGWDNQIILRLKEEHIKLRIPESGTVINNGDKPTIDDKIWKKVKKSNIINNHSETWKKNGLNNNFHIIKKVKTIIDNCVKYSIDIYDETYYLIGLNDIEQEIGGEVTEKTLRLEIKFSDKEPELKKEYGYLPEDMELVNMYHKSLGKYKDMNNILFPYEFIESTSYDYNKWTIKLKLAHNKYPINNFKLDDDKYPKKNYYLYEIIKNIKNDFNHTNKINILHINVINLNKVKNNNTIANHEDLFLDTIKLAFNKKNINKTINYKLVLFCKYYNNPDLVTNPHKYKIEGNNTVFNRLATHSDYVKLKTQCKNEKFDLVLFNYDSHENYIFYNNMKYTNLLAVISLLFKLYLLLNVLNKDGSIIIAHHALLYSKSNIDIIYLLKKYFKSIKINKHKLIASNKITYFIICEKFKGYNNEYNNIFKNVFTEKLYNQIISNKNLDKLYIPEILPDISYITKYNFLNTIVNFNQKYIINKYDYYTILNNIDKLSEKDQSQLIKQLYKYKQKLKIKYFNHL